MWPLSDRRPREVSFHVYDRPRRGSAREHKVESWFPRAGTGEEMASDYRWVGGRFLFGVIKIKILWNWIVVMFVLRSEYTKNRYTVHIKTVKFMFFLYLSNNF